jgi:hypothetical protein
VQIREQASGSFDLTVRARQHGAALERVLEPKTCADALEAAAVVVALAVDPNSRAAEAEGPPPRDIPRKKGLTVRSALLGGVALNVLPVRAVQAMLARAARRTSLVRIRSRSVAVGSAARMAWYTVRRLASANTRRALRQSRPPVLRISAPKTASAPPCPTATARSWVDAIPQGRAQTSVSTAA